MDLVPIHPVADELAGSLDDDLRDLGSVEGRRRLLVALSWMVQAGDAATAAGVADDLRALPPGPLRDNALGSLAMARDDPAGAGEMYESAWKHCDDPGTDPEVAATIANQGEYVRATFLRGERGRATRATSRCTARCSPDSRGRAAGRGSAGSGVSPRRSRPTTG